MESRAPMASPLPRDAARRLGRDLPSWLASCVVHLTLLIILALFVSQAPRGDLLGLQAEFSGEGGSPEATGLAAEPSVEIATESLAELAPEAVELPEIETVTSATHPAALSSGEGAAGEGGFGDGGLDLGLAPGQTSVFGVVEEASSFVYVFDHSESMNSKLTYTSEGRKLSITPLEAAKAELLRSLSDLDPRQRFQLIFYNHEPLVFTLGKAAPRMLAATSENKKRATTFIQRLPGEGGTYHFEPLRLALQMSPESIYLMTDAQVQDDPTGPELEEIKLLNRKRTRINVINFTFAARPPGTLEQLAKENRGQFLGIDLSKIGRGVSSPSGFPLQPDTQSSDDASSDTLTALGLAPRPAP